MARNDEEEIRKLEAEAVQLGYSVAVERSLAVGELELVNQFRWIASHLRMSAKAPTERKRIRREISKLSDVVRRNTSNTSIDLHDECVGEAEKTEEVHLLVFPRPVHLLGA